jgi:glycosyltransferase involved in cell wall biosynthesis/2-polyprenyl-3-methyl-5-hydroxy-6-metoxy-1,4-benzoquinol methylase
MHTDDLQPTDSHQRACWCGNTRLEAFSPDYAFCSSCGSLVVRHAPAPGLTAIGEDEAGLYGEGYWFAHQEQDLHQPNIIDRARADMAERCLWWLRTLLRYRVPPARVLELGSAHGGFVALLRQAGFDATGLEVSPAIVRFARETFDAPMLQGPVEQQLLSPGSFDVIALMDVLEHLVDPIATMQRCFELLTPDGLVLIQTPRLPQRASLADLMDRQDPFLRMLQPQEHVYLFSESALVQLSERLDARVVFEPAIFSHYDMFAVVSRGSLTTLPADAADKALLSRPQSRISLALLDLDARARSLEQRLEQRHGDIAARDEQLDQALRWLRESETDRAARLAQIEVLTTTVRESEADRLARGEQIGTLTQTLKDSETDRQARWDQLQALTGALQQSERDREHLRDSLSLASAQLEASRVEARTFEARLSDLQLKVSGEQAGVSPHADPVRDLEAAVHRSQEDKAQAIGALQALRRSGWYRLLVRSGRWAHFDEVISQIEATSVEKGRLAIPAPDVAMKARDLRRVAVDLTPVLPGTENGGAKVFTIHLIRGLARMAPDCEFVLLTSVISHDELGVLDAVNVRRVCVAGNPDQDARDSTARLTALTKLARRFVPKRLRPRLRQIIPNRQRRKSERLLAGMRADVLFCPFTAPYYYEPRVPCVSVIYDLQHRTYPEFFEQAEVFERERTFRNVCRSSDRLICISGYVRDKVLEHGTVSADRVSVIHLCPMPHGSSEPADAEISRVRAGLGLVSGRYLLYPANFWRHKNHEILLIAVAGFIGLHPDSDLRLVCTGTPGPRLDWLRGIAARMGLGHTVMFTEYVPDDAYQNLLDGCRALIFPSLYEGFGIPVVEAMAAGRPVACSGTTSLPEVTAGAALLFDPRKPEEILQAIERLEFDEPLRRELIEKGYARAIAFGTLEDLAHKYLDVLKAAGTGVRRHVDGITGLYDDNWTKGEVVVTYAESKVARRVELDLVAPAWTSATHVTVEVRGKGVARQRLRIGRGEPCTVAVNLPMTPGHFQLAIAPLSQPAACGAGSDERLLGCLCKSCRFVVRGVTRDLLSRTA